MLYILILGEKEAKEKTDKERSSHDVVLNIRATLSEKKECLRLHQWTFHIGFL